MTNPSQERARNLIQTELEGLQTVVPFNCNADDGDPPLLTGTVLAYAQGALMPLLTPEQIRRVVDALLPTVAAEFEELEREALRIGDEINQCLQIIVTNAGNIKDDRDGPILEECDAIEAAVARAAKAVRKLAALEAKQAGAKEEGNVNKT